jgi:hypothetical protein
MDSRLVCGIRKLDIFFKMTVPLLTRPLVSVVLPIHAAELSNSDIRENHFVGGHSIIFFMQRKTCGCPIDF